MSRLVLAHELAHIALGATADGRGDERAANQATLEVLAGRTLQRRAPSGGLALRGCEWLADLLGPSPAPSPAAKAPPPPTLDPGAAPSRDDVAALLDRFETLSAAEQETVVANAYTPGSFGGHIRTGLDALNPEDWTGRYRDTIRRILELVEQIEVRASSGMSDTDMAIAQASWMDTPNPAAAAPTPAQAQARRQSTTSSGNLPSRPTNRWTDPATNQATYNAAVADVEAAVVAHGTSVAPELGITTSHMHFDPNAIEGASDTRVAEYDRANNRLNYGMKFLERVDPALPGGHGGSPMVPEKVIGLVIHEVFGHGEYGGIGDSYALDIYTDAFSRTSTSTTAAERAAGPTSDDRFAYGYQGTEIYSELREFQYRTGANPLGDTPANDIRRRVGLIGSKASGSYSSDSQWPEDLAKAFLRGMYARFALDPRITAAALQVYRDAVDHHFPGENVLATTP